MFAEAARRDAPRAGGCLARLAAGISGMRIVGGEWGGRRITAPPGRNTRPTTDRVREAWMSAVAPWLPDANVIDLFAGSGALGLEALSRGAAEVCFVERQLPVARALEQALARLGCESPRASVVAADAARFLGGRPRPFDLVFLDPPFGEADHGELCTLLDGGWLAAGARVYLEMARDQPLPPLPPDWVVLREKAAGQVRFALAQRPASP